MSPGPVVITCEDCGAKIACPVTLERIPVSPVGELRYRMHVDPEPWHAHLDGRATLRSVPPPDGT